MWRYPKIWKNKVFLQFCCFQQILEKRGVALCGGIPKFEKTKLFFIFAVFFCFQQISKKQAWRYVALCGAMWRYPEN